MIEEHRPQKQRALRDCARLLLRIEVSLFTYLRDRRSTRLALSIYMSCRSQFALLLCLMTLQSTSVFGQNGAPPAQICNILLGGIPEATKLFISQDPRFDLSRPHKIITRSELERVLAPNITRTDEQVYVNFDHVGMTRILKSTQDTNDGTPEARLIRKSDIYGKAREMNSFRIYRVNAPSEDLEGVDADENDDIAGDEMDPKTKALQVSEESMDKGLRKFTEGLNKTGKNKGAVVLEILHVHPLAEILFTDKGSGYVIFPPSIPDVAFAKKVSRKMDGLPVILTVLVPNGYSYSMAFINDENATLRILKNVHEN